MAILEPKLDPSPRELFQFAAFVWPTFFALVGGAVLYSTGSWPLAAGIWLAAGSVSALGLLFPAFMRVVFVGLVRVTLPIGIAVTWLLLAGIFFGVMTPLGLLSRAVRKDPLARDVDREATSYWTRYTPPDEADRYFEQF